MTQIKSCNKQIQPWDNQQRSTNSIITTTTVKQILIIRFTQNSSYSCHLTGMFREGLCIYMYMYVYISVCMFVCMLLLRKNNTRVLLTFLSFLWMQLNLDLLEINVRILSLVVNKRNRNTCNILRQISSTPDTHINVLLSKKVLFNCDFNEFYYFISR